MKMLSDISMVISIGKACQSLMESILRQQRGKQAMPVFSCCGCRQSAEAEPALCLLFCQISAAFSLQRYILNKGCSLIPKATHLHQSEQCPWWIETPRWEHAEGDVFLYWLQKYSGKIYCVSIVLKYM